MRRFFYSPENGMVWFGLNGKPDNSGGGAWRGKPGSTASTSLWKIDYWELGHHLHPQAFEIPEWSAMRFLHDGRVPLREDMGGDTDEHLEEI